MSKTHDTSRFDNKTTITTNHDSITTLDPNSTVLSNAETITIDSDPSLEPPLVSIPHLPTMRTLCGELHYHIYAEVVGGSA